MGSGASVASVEPGQEPKAQNPSRRRHSFHEVELRSQSNSGVVAHDDVGGLNRAKSHGGVSQARTSGHMTSPPQTGSQQSALYPSLNESHHMPQSTVPAERKAAAHQLQQTPDNRQPAHRQHQTPDIPPQNQAQSAEDTTYQENEEEVMFETFYHMDGSTYTCIRLDGVHYFTTDFGNQDWMPVPEEWLDESAGLFITDNSLRSGDDSGIQQEDMMQMVYGEEGLKHLKGKANAQQTASSAGGSNSHSVPAHSTNTDDRAGVIRNLPGRRGVTQTYLYSERRNYHCYFEESIGTWIPLPLSWELQSETANALVSQIQAVLPNWRDSADVLTALRASNYDVNACIEVHNLTTSSGQPAAGFHHQGNDSKAALQATNQQLQQLLGAEKEKSRQLEQRLKSANENSFKDQTTIKRLESRLKSAQEELHTRAEIQLAASKSSSAPAASQLDHTKLSRVRATMVSFRSSYTDLRTCVEDSLKDLGASLSAVLEHIQKLHSVHISMRMVSNDQYEELRSLYRRECAVRRMLYNQLQELRGNIRVFARCRRDDSCKAAALTITGDEDISVDDQRGHERRFTFDRAYGPESTQQEVYGEISAIVTSCVDGYNICVLAYGQTGSGKTHTMMGSAEDPGVNVRVIEELLSITNDRQNVDYILSLSMVEIYNEVVQDLLSPNCGTITVRHAGTMVDMVGLTVRAVKTQKDITDLMALGMTNRTVAATNMNSHRSHLLVMLTVEGTDRTSRAKSRGVLTLVDLAGSERISKTDAVGQRLVEAAAINKSLTALGQVFTALSKSALHVPFRNSKLTQVLQPSLSGDAKAVLLVTVSPAESNLSETLSTLTFGSNAKRIELGPVKSNRTN